MAETEPITKPLLSDVWKAIRRSPALCIMVVLAIIGFSYHQSMENKVFPTASLDLKYSSKQILLKAREYAEKFGYKQSGGITSIKFDSDENAKLFLERTYGQTEANRLMQNTLPVWYWACEFKVPGQKEQASLQLSPTGELLNYDRTLENDRCLPSVDEAKARSIATSFVETEAKFPVSKWELIESEDQKQINRLDHSFTWQDPADFKGAHRRVSVNVCGDTVCLFDITVHTPQSWDRSYKTMRSSNELLSVISFFAFSVLCIATFFLFVRALQTKTCNLKVAIGFGVFFGLAVLASSLNAFPSWAAEYNTDQAWDLFLLKQFSLSLLGAAVSGVLIALLVGAVQPMYRQVCPDRIPIQKWFSSNFLRSPQFIEAIIVGYAVCGLAQGYQVAYYSLGERLHYWCPLQVAEFQTFSNMFPFVDALSIGIMAAIMEEGLYRVVGLGLFTKLFRGNFWLANLLQAAAWGFMHSNYPQQPAYARGVELTIEGVFDGWILRRFGFLAAMLWHYTFDAFCGVEPLRAAPPSVAWTGAIPLGIPAVMLVVGLLIAWKRGWNNDHADIAEHRVEEDKHEEKRKTELTFIPAPLSSFVYKPMLNLQKQVAIVILSVGAFVAGIYFDVPSIFRQTKPLSATREQAVAAARDYYKGQNINLDGYLVSAEVVGGIVDQPQITYMNEQLGFARTKETLESVENPMKWYVRFCKPQQAEEYSIYLNQQGHVLAPSISLQDVSVGANLNKTKALEIAQNFLKRYRPEYCPFEYRDQSQEVLKNRTDYKFSFVVPRWKAADADLKVNVEVSGDQVSELSHSWMLPDKWRTPYNEKSLLDQVLVPLRMVGWILGIVAVLWVAIELIRGHYVRWKWPCLIGAAAFVLQLASAVCKAPAYFLRYQTTTPLDSFLVTNNVQMAISFALMSFILILMSALASGAMVKCCEGIDIRSAFNLAFAVQPKEKRALQASMWTDAILMVMAFVSVTSITTIGIKLLQAKFAHDPAVTSLPGAVANAAYHCMPLVIGGSSFTTMVMGVSALIAVPYMIYRFTRGKAVFWIPLTVVSILVFDTEAKYASDYLLSALPTLIAAGLLWWLVVRHSRNNFLSPMIWAWALILPEVLNIKSYGLPLFANDYFALLALFFSPLAYLTFLQWAPAPKAAPAPALHAMPAPIPVEPLAASTEEFSPPADSP